MKTKRMSVLAPILCIAFGALFGVLTTGLLEDMIAAMWTPLAIALYFLSFTLLLCGLIMLLVHKWSSGTDRKWLFRDMAILLAAVFLVSMLFEFLYELGADATIPEADAYVLMIDDSGSMSSNDPNQQRGQAINTLLKDKSADFPYAIYTFADTAVQVRGMQPKSAGYDNLPLQTSGGTAMFTCLRTASADMDSGKLPISPATRVLLISDGYAGDMPLFTGSVLKDYVKKNIIISTIGLGDNVDTYTMKKIAESTGGVYIHINEAAELDTALLDAAIGSSERHLLGYRGFCITNTLHGILRVVFILLIVALIFVLKIYACGKFYWPHLIVSGICCLVAAFLPEIGLEVFSWNVDTMRIVFCTLIAVTLIELVQFSYRAHSGGDDASSSNYSLDGIQNLDKTIGIDESDIQSLG